MILLQKHTIKIKKKAIYSMLKFKLNFKRILAMNILPIDKKNTNNLDSYWRVFYAFNRENCWLLNQYYY